MSTHELPLRWAALYTRGLAGDVADERRLEIASDVWEHRAMAGPGWRSDVAIVSRTVRGIPADLSWRRSQRSGVALPSRGTVLRALGWAAGLISYLFLLGNFGWGATGLVGGLALYGDDWAPGDVEWYSRVSLALLVLLITGAALLRSHPRVGAGTMLVALAPLPILFWWAAPIYAPMMVAVGASTITLARRRRRTLQARASSATS